MELRFSAPSAARVGTWSGFLGLRRCCYVAEQVLASTPAQKMRIHRANKEERVGQYEEKAYASNSGDSPRGGSTVVNVALATCGAMACTIGSQDLSRMTP